MKVSVNNTEMFDSDNDKDRGVLVFGFIRKDGCIMVDGVGDVSIDMLEACQEAIKVQIERKLGNNVPVDLSKKPSTLIN